MSHEPHPPAPHLPAQLSLDFGAPPAHVIAVAAGTLAPSDPAEVGTVPGTERRILLAGENCSYRLRRGRRRTIGFQIDDRGLTVSAPRSLALREIEAVMRANERWIRTRLQRWQQWQAKRSLPQVAFAAGGRLPYLGEPLTLHLRPDRRASALLTGAQGKELHLALPPDAAEAQVRDAVQTWLKDQARRILGQRLDALCHSKGLHYHSWALSSARAQWGSCTADGRIRLNWRLVHFTLPIIDYVVAHELAHLKELNHGPQFWAQLAHLLPGFEAARDQIRNQNLVGLPL